MTPFYVILLKLLCALLLVLGSGLVFWVVLRMDAAEWDQTGDRGQR